jgi:predicted anti-sigma-YlaC factor YlaD
VTAVDEMTCQELTELLTDYLEGAMPPDQAALLEAHLEVCEGCVNYISQMSQTLRTLRRLRADSVEATAPPQLVEAFRAWKLGEPAPGR